MLGPRHGRSSVVVLVAALTAVGATLRFATLDRQSFWLDELVTVSLLRMDFDDLLRAIPESEATPYLYYVLAWPWTRLFGFGEVGLRSLSALAGAAIVPVAYGAGAVLVSRRTGLVAAALVSVHPFLVWYSQEARAYSLFALLAAVQPALLRTGSARGRALGVRGLGRCVLARARDALLRGLPDRPGGRVAPPSLPGTTASRCSRPCSPPSSSSSTCRSRSTNGEPVRPSRRRRSCRESPGSRRA